jgi:low temperature requirement protein LtrA
MCGRDPSQLHRTSSPLELLFDLCFVVSVAQAATQMHEAIAEGHFMSGLVGYLRVFFSIWWAWMNFTWFASAYDTDDVPYRLLTMVHMGGVLVMAAGIPGAFERGDFVVITVGYLIMRASMVGHWLRAAVENPAGRATAIRYAVGIAVAQAGWVAKLWLPGRLAAVGVVAMIAVELAVPIWAELRGTRTNWHPGHIIDRYAAFTIIVHGEVILATLAALREARHDASTLLMIAGGGLTLVFGLWWIYFADTEPALPTLRTAWTWGYAHYIMFAAVAALGAGLEAVVDTGAHHSELAARPAAFAVAIPVAVSMFVVAALHRLTDVGSTTHLGLLGVGGTVVLALALTPPAFTLAEAVLAMGLVVGATVATELLVIRATRRRYASASQDRITID